MERIIEKLPPIFAGLGLFGILIAGGLYLSAGDLSRYALPLVAASLCLIIYYFVERPQGLIRLVTGRSARYGSNAFLMSISFIAILALVNVLGARYSYNADLTQSRQFTLSPQTDKILSELNVPVRATVFATAGSQSETDTRMLLDQFVSHTKNLTVTYVDPNAKPGIASQYKITADGTTVFEVNGKQQQVVGTTEGELISGLLKVTRGTPKNVYFVIGHGEPDTASTDQSGFSEAKSALEAENYKVSTLNLVATPKVPDDAAVVILAGPTSALQPAESQALTDYLDKGGTALVLADTDKMAGLAALADRYDVQIKRGVVIELGQSLPNDPLTPIITGAGYLPSPITQSMPTLTLFPTSELVEPKADQATSKYTVTPLLRTTEHSWLETDTAGLAAGTTPTIDVNSDVVGPVTIAASVISNAPVGTGDTAKTTRLVFVGDVDFATNGVLNYEGNRDFLVNSVNWLAEEEDLISVRAKDTTNRQMILSSDQMSLVLYSTVIALPLLVLGLGAWVYWGKR